MDVVVVVACSSSMYIVVFDILHGCCYIACDGCGCMTLW